MKTIKSLILLSAVCSLLLISGCFSSFESINESENGVMIEQLLPKDTWLVLSITTKDGGQREAFNDFASKFSGEEDFLGTMTQQFADMGLSYESDIAPILGEDGFRFVMAYAEQDAYVAMTVSDIEKTQAWLDAMVDRGEAEVVALGDKDMYSATLEGRESYTMLIDDVLMVAGTAASLLNSEGRLEAGDAESLLDNEEYMTSVKEVESPYLGYVYMNYDSYEEMTGSPFGVGSFFGMGSYLMDNQVWAVGFEDEQIVLSGYSDGDRETIDNLDFGLDETQGDEIYLADSVPAADLVLYDESGNLAGLIDLWIHRNGQDIDASYESIDSITTQFFSLDFATEIRTFLDKGYAAIIHDNGSVSLPAISVIVDVSSDLNNAKELMTRMDSQIDSVIMMMQYDETGTWDSLSKTETSVLGGEFNVVSMYTDVLSSVYETYVGGTPPAEGEVFTLSYGITADGLLILSTYDGWELFDGQGSLAEDPAFVEMTKATKGYDDTVLYVNLDEVVNYLGLLDGYAPSSVMLEGEEVTADSAQSTIAEYLESLDAALFGVKADRYKVWMKGIVK